MNPPQADEETIVSAVSAKSRHAGSGFLLRKAASRCSGGTRGRGDRDIVTQKEVEEEEEEEADDDAEVRQRCRREEDDEEIAREPRTGRRRYSRYPTSTGPNAVEMPGRQTRRKKKKQTIIATRRRGRERHDHTDPSCLQTRQPNRRASACMTRRLRSICSFSGDSKKERETSVCKRSKRVARCVGAREGAARKSRGFSGHLPSARRCLWYSKHAPAKISRRRKPGRYVHGEGVARYASGEASVGHVGGQLGQSHMRGREAPTVADCGRGADRDTC